MRGRCDSFVAISRVRLVACDAAPGTLLSRPFTVAYVTRNVPASDVLMIRAEWVVVEV